MRFERGKNGSEVGLSRRAYLGAVGGTAGLSVLGTARSTSEYEHVVDMVAAGADNSGQELIDDVFDDHANDDTLLKFPPGRYLANELIIYKRSHFAMVGDDATLVPGPNYREDVWLGGGEVRDVRIENFTIDTTADGIAPEIDISAYDGLTVRNVHKAGYHDGTGIAFFFQVYESDGQALVENVTAPDGGTAVGMYIQGNGAFTVRDCHIEGFTNNGLYASYSEAPVTVEGGTFRNNNVSQVRLGSADSSVTGATIEVTTPVLGPDAEIVNMRGVRVADGPGPVRVDDCDIVMEAAQGSGGIVTAYSGGSLEVTNTRIYVDSEYTTIGSNGSRTSWGIFVDDPGDGVAAGTRTFQDVSITGGGSYRSGLLIRRGDTTIDGLCLDQTGDGRDGIRFEDGTNNVVSNATIDVPDQSIVLDNATVDTSNISYSGSCPTPPLGDDTPPASLVDGEVGQLRSDQPTADTWRSVAFDGHYDAPVVISDPLSYADAAPCHVRLDAVDAGGFSYVFEEWPYLDGMHDIETASFVAVDAATTTRGIAAGTVDANHRFTGFEWPGTFDALPVVFAQPQTVNGTDPIVPRLRNVTTDGAEVRVQESEGSPYDGYHYIETLGYVAIKRGSVSVGGRRAETGFVSGGVDEDWAHVEFTDTFEVPRFVAAIQTFNGPNTANLRYRNLTGTGVDVMVEEEQSADVETGHVFERVGYMVVEGA